MEDHIKYMELALKEAEKAEKKGEVPVGALLISASGIILSRSHNETIKNSDPTAHAEINAIREAGRVEKNYRFPGTILYTTVEPCIMCMGAIIHSRIKTLVYGTKDPRWGGAGSLYDFSLDSRLNHRIHIIPGILKTECSDLMRNFFRIKRKFVGKSKILT